jgi:ABC-type Fe3+/spermidine/putrescine transport system ATPase subunit
MAAIRLAAVENRILKGINLEIEEGELFVLLGPSGAGKTSLLRATAGLAPHRGDVFFQGRRVNRLPPHRRRAGFVFQDLRLFPHLTVGGNIMLAMKNTGLKRAAKISRRSELLEMLNIGRLLQRRPGEISGGERQRVALARALASDPRILLLDEPFNSLDFRTARRLRRELKSLQRRLGLATLFVTHGMEEAKAMADRMAVMREGRLREVGTPAELWGGQNGGAPSFLERSNLLTPSVQRNLGNGLVEVAWAGVRLAIPDSGRSFRRLAVSPDRVRLGPAPPPGPAVNRFQALVTGAVENETVCHLALEVSGQALMADVPAAQWRDWGLEPGAKLHAMILPGDLRPW